LTGTASMSMTPSVHPADVWSALVRTQAIAVGTTTTANARRLARRVVRRVAAGKGRRRAGDVPPQRSKPAAPEPASTASPADPLAPTPPRPGSTPPGGPGPTELAPEPPKPERVEIIESLLTPSENPVFDVALLQALNDESRDKPLVAAPRSLS